MRTSASSLKGLALDLTAWTGSWPRKGPRAKRLTLIIWVDDGRKRDVGKGPGNRLSDHSKPRGVATWALDTARDRHERSGR